MTTDCSLAAVQYRISVWNASRLLITFFLSHPIVLKLCTEKSSITPFHDFKTIGQLQREVWTDDQLENCQLQNWKLNQNTKLFIHKNATENIVCEIVDILSSGGGGGELKSLWYTLIILSQPHSFQNVVCRMEFYYYWKDVLTPFLLFCYSVEPHLISNVISKRKSPWCGLTTKLLALRHFQHVCNKYHA